jgi:hypothetical protein
MSPYQVSAFAALMGGREICIHFFLILEVKTEVKFVYTGGQNKDEICIQKVKAKEIFVYSISSILRIFLGSKQRLLLYIRLNHM